MKKVQAFHNSCLRKINKIFWHNKISNKNLHLKCKSKNISTEIKQRRMRWLGHVMRMPQSRIPKTALQWTPPRKRKRGRPRTTWRRTVTPELEEVGYSWGQAQFMPRTERNGGNLLKPYVPLGMKRISKKVIF